MEEMEHSISAIKAQRAECYAGIDEIQQKITEASVRQNTARMNVEQVQRQQTESRQRCESYAKEQEERCGRSVKTGSRFRLNWKRQKNWKLH